MEQVHPQYLRGSFPAVQRSPRNTSGLTLTLLEECEQDRDEFGRFVAGEADAFAYIAGGVHVEVLCEPRRKRPVPLSRLPEMVVNVRVTPEVLGHGLRC
jgi:hypothetical protein